MRYYNLQRTKAPSIIKMHNCATYSTCERWVLLNTAYIRRYRLRSEWKMIIMISSQPHTQWRRYNTTLALWSLVPFAHRSCSISYNHITYIIIIIIINSRVACISTEKSLSCEIYNNALSFWSSIPAHIIITLHWAGFCVEPLSKLFVFKDIGKHVPDYMAEGGVRLYVVSDAVECCLAHDPRIMCTYVSFVITKV